MSRVDESTPWANRCGCCPPKTIGTRNAALREIYDGLKAKGMADGLMDIDSMLDIEVEQRAKFWGEWDKIMDARSEMRQVDRNARLKALNEATAWDGMAGQSAKTCSCDPLEKFRGLSGQVHYPPPQY